MNHPENYSPSCLLVSENAQELKAEITRLSETPIHIKVCVSTEEALASYDDEQILFGRPDMVAQILPRMPSIRWVQSTWAGVEPLVALEYRNYQLTVIKDVFGPQMSEYVYGYLLAHELKQAKRTEHQRNHRWFDAHSGSLLGKRIGIMGTGSIGRHIAKTGQVFGLNTVGLSRSGTPITGFDQVIPLDQFDNFLAGLDYVVAALPGTPGTTHLLNAESLALLPAHAYLVNIGRSNVIDTGALKEVLSRGELAGAALDVFDEEPIPQDSPLWDTPNLSITAHIAAVSHPSLIVPVFLDNYQRFTSKEPLKHVFNFEAGY